MLRYRNEGTTISVSLPKTDYTVYMMANYNKDTDAYHTKLYIMRNDVEDLNLIDDKFKFKSNFSTLKLDMANYITEQFNKGYFKYYKLAGTSILNGKEFNHYKIYKGSSEYDTKEMSILLNGVVQEAKNLGIKTKDDIELERLLEEWC